MIVVDENDPVGEVEASFPYRDVQLKKGSISKDIYDVSSEELGRGTYGTVYVCREKTTGLQLAAKFVKVTCKEDRRNMEREIEIMSGLHHPRIIQLYDAFDDGSTIICVLELIQGGELFERVIEEDYVLTEKACTIFIRQICEGVDFLHSRDILHLDLKPENVLCLSRQGNRIKLIDFGMSRRYDPTKKLQILFGTAEFVAPEIVSFDAISHYTDMWAVGVICYVLLSGLSPFMGDTDIDTMTNVTLCKYNFDDDAFNQVSDCAKHFIQQLLQKDGSKRLTTQDALNHPWLINSAFNTELHVTKTKLKRYVIKKRWIKAVNTIIALRRMGAKIDFDLV
ncbi:myosin light chain kinase 2, skeletal/cardiac muscle-like [Contarinia nasturtii]|uniref:myosin light chain kinase 2, skeletal/cardiac muscle-like n=1 Tax=Contarinia nasturtii TaxID=265458 RepID=UPI0012D49B3A|nr:myosin light chain kinase 2, skeletal/cardiac muscle-like [Contarinia nasturtii]XP_031620742.1 myosin light chain kinase 2, skeletal/cardiac muscle-like [Contarinia nasturtii]